MDTETHGSLAATITMTSYLKSVIDTLGATLVTKSQAQIYREWGVAIVKGRAECLLALLECTVPNASPRSKVACGKSRDKLIERANVAHCSGGFAEAVQLRRRYAVMKEAARARRR